MAFVLSPEIKIGDLLTVGSVLIGASALLYAMLKDRVLRHREYADRVRHSAANTLAAVERWKGLAERLFVDCQSALTETDILVVKGQDVIAARDFLWKSLVDLEAKISARILAENLQGAYAPLYAYDPAIHRAFASVTNTMQGEFAGATLMLLKATQREVMDTERAPYHSAELGNRLREITHEVALLFSRRADEVILPLATAMLKLVTASDTAIVRKQACTFAFGDAPSGMLTGPADSYPAEDVRRMYEDR